MGYTKETWDADAEIEYDEKDFADCTVQEKHAAMYLGMNPIDEKLDIWWSETDDETKAFATVLGFDQHKWDEDWELKDLPCEHWYWKDMTEEQKDAAIHFGYSRALWDETEDDDDEEFEAAVSTVLVFVFHHFTYPRLTLIACHSNESFTGCFGQAPQEAVLQTSARREGGRRRLRQRGIGRQSQWLV